MIYLQNYEQLIDDQNPQSVNKNITALPQKLITEFKPACLFVKVCHINVTNNGLKMQTILMKLSRLFKILISAIFTQSKIDLNEFQYSKFYESKIFYFACKLTILLNHV